MERVERVLGLAGVQHGAVSRRQVRALGIDWTAEDRLVRRGVLQRANPRVLLAAGSAPTAHRGLMVAVLGAGPAAVGSLHAAAWLWRLPRFGPACDVTRLRGLTSTGGGRLHQPRLLLAHHVTRVDGIPVTSLARTLFDLAPFVHPDRMARLVDTVITKSPAMGAVLHRTLGELACKGRAGITVMREVLDARPPGTPVAASGLESKFEQILGNAGEPVPERQVDVGGHAWIGRVDYRDGELRILFEIDSNTHHRGLLDATADAIRDEALLAAGWTAVVRIAEADVWGRPWVVLHQVREARREARALLATTSPPERR